MPLSNVPTDDELQRAIFDCIARQPLTQAESLDVEVTERKQLDSDRLRVEVALTVSRVADDPYGALDEAHRRINQCLERNEILPQGFGVEHAHGKPSALEDRSHVVLRMWLTISPSDQET